MATLGDLLNAQNSDKFSEGVTKESKAASSAYIPGYSKQSISDSESPNDRTIGGGLTGHADVPLAGNSDLHLDALRALSNFTWIKLANANTYAPDANRSDATGLKREDVFAYGPTGYAPTEDFENPETGEIITKVPPELQTKGGPYSIGAHTDTLATLIQSTDNHKIGPGSGVLRSVKPITAGTESSNDVSNFGNAKLPSQTALPEESNLIPHAAYRLLEQANRYSPSDSTPYVLPADAGKRGEKRLGKGLYSLQGGSFGKFNPAAKGVTVLELRRAAMEVIHRAQSFSAESAEIQGRQMQKRGTPFTGESELAALIPHLTQVGAGTIGINALRARSTAIMDGFDLSEGANDILDLESFKTAMGFGGDTDESTNYTSRNATSYGTMNSPAEPFNGVAPFGMIVPVIYAIIILALFGLAIGALISAIGRKSAKPKNVENPSSLQFGANAVGEGESIGEKFLDIYNLPREGGLNFNSMVRGIMLFFGINFNPVMPGSTPAMDAFINLLLGPGYYLVISKKILADFTQVSRSIENFTNIIGPFSFITIFLSSIEALMSSFTVRWFIVMNNIGVVVEKSISRVGEAGHAGGNVIPLSEQETQKALTPAIRNSISRWHGGAGQPKSPLSAHLFSTLLASPVDSLGLSKMSNPKNSDQSAENNATIRLNTVPLPAGGRFSPEAVAKWEKAIDSEYMPFSIHDLRTNEVISLPAFINNISDDFTAEYNTTHGYGRTDPVHAYTKTTRNINLGFTLVAMNPDDHDYVWYLVNKFVAMVYPQRDAGLLRKTEEGQVFAQPFSQRIVASPVIRIRLGDVIGSNSTTSAMKKIFGGSSIMSQTKNETTAEVREGAKQNSTYLKAKGLVQTGILSYTTNKLLDGTLKAQDGVYTIPGGTTLYAVVDEKYFEFSLQCDRALKLGEYINHPKAAKRKKKVTDDPSSVTTVVTGYWEVDLTLEDDLAAYVLGGLPLLTAYRKANEGIPIPPPPFGPAPVVKVLVPNTTAAMSIAFEPSADFIAKEVAKGKSSEMFGQLPSSDVIESQDAMEAAKSLSPPDEAVEATIESFLSPESNSFVKSFESTKGNGLAGVITQLGLDYGESVWGTTFEEGAQITGRRAPKVIKITMAFSPIHDMPLGLNHNGEIFAPSHPVGLLSRKREELEASDADKAFNDKKLAAIGELPDTTDPGAPKLPF